MKVSKQNKILVKLIFSLLFSGLTLSYTSALQISKVSGPKTSP